MEVRRKLLTLSFILLISLAGRTTSEETKEDSKSDEVKSKDAKVDERWSKYMRKIDKALKEYKPCDAPEGDCLCYLDLIDKDLALWEDGITKSDFEQAKARGTHYQIINHKLYRQHDCMFPFRCSGVEYFILQVVDRLPDMEMSINTRDWPQTHKSRLPFPVFSFSKDDSTSDDIMYPAWTFWEGGPAVWPIYPRGLGRWEKMRGLLAKSAKVHPWEDKENKAFFRGSRTSAERDPLILLSREEPDLVDAEYTKNQAYKSEEDTLFRPPAQEIKLEDHCPYKYLFNFRGVAASFRFKHLFLCDSLVFHVGDEYKEFFYYQLKPWVHYIPVDSDLSDVKELIEFAQNNDETVREIAKRGRQFIWDHLRNDDVTCYWYHLLKKYAALMKWKPRRDPEFQLLLPPKIRDEL